MAGPFSPALLALFICETNIAFLDTWNPVQNMWLKSKQANSSSHIEKKIPAMLCYSHTTDVDLHDFLGSTCSLITAGKEWKMWGQSLDCRPGKEPQRSSPVQLLNWKSKSPAMVTDLSKFTQKTGDMTRTRTESASCLVLLCLHHRDFVQQHTGSWWP